MASWRWLLVLWQLSWFQMGDSGFTSFKTSDQPGWKKQTVPTDGMYIVSVFALPCYHCWPVVYLTVFLERRNFFMHIFTVTADSMASHTEVAIALKQNDLLSLYESGSVQHPSSFSIAYVSGLDGSYTTVYTSSVTSFAVPQFNRLLEGSSWRMLRGNQASSFSVPTTGMYWVTARVVPMSYTASLIVTNELSGSASPLFTVLGEKKTGRLVLWCFSSESW